MGRLVLMSTTHDIINSLVIASNGNLPLAVQELQRQLNGGTQAFEPVKIKVDGEPRTIMVSRLFKDMFHKKVEDGPDFFCNLQQSNPQAINPWLYNLARQSLAHKDGFFPEDDAYVLDRLDTFFGLQNGPMPYTQVHVVWSSYTFKSGRRREDGAASVHGGKCVRALKMFAVSHPITMGEALANYNRLLGHERLMLLTRHSHDLAKNPWLAFELWKKKSKAWEMLGVLDDLRRIARFGYTYAMLPRDGMSNGGAFGGILSGDVRMRDLTGINGAANVGIGTHKTLLEAAKVLCASFGEVPELFTLDIAKYAGTRLQYNGGPRALSTGVINAVAPKDGLINMTAGDRRTPLYDEDGEFSAMGHLYIDAICDKLPWWDKADHIQRLGTIESLQTAWVDAFHSLYPRLVKFLTAITTAAEKYQDMYGKDYTFKLPFSGEHTPGKWMETGKSTKVTLWFDNNIYGKGGTKYTMSHKEIKKVQKATSLCVYMIQYLEGETAGLCILLHTLENMDNPVVAQRIGQIYDCMFVGHESYNTINATYTEAMKLTVGCTNPAIGLFEAVGMTHDYLMVNDVNIAEHLK